MQSCGASQIWSHPRSFLAEVRGNPTTMLAALEETIGSGAMGSNVCVSGRMEWVATAARPPPSSGLI